MAMNPVPCLPASKMVRKSSKSSIELFEARRHAIIDNIHCPIDPFHNYISVMSIGTIRLELNKHIHFTYTKPGFSHLNAGEGPDDKPPLNPCLVHWRFKEDFPRLRVL